MRQTTFKFLMKIAAPIFLVNAAFAWSNPGYEQPPQTQFYRTHYNYFKASMGTASVSDDKDASGSLMFDESTVLPINLAYGFTGGNIAFEGELGFSNNELEFAPSDLSRDAWDGNISSTKLMFNGFYKTSATGSNIYLGGGLGFLSVSMDGLEQDLTGGSLATQVILGGELRTNERSGFFVEYKYLKSIGLEVENNFVEADLDFKESSLNVGFRLYL